MDNASSQAKAGADSALPIVGQRRQFYFNDTGQPAYQTYDLTGDDFLNPQAGDEFFHGDVHERSVRILGSMLHFHYRYSPSASVHIRSKMIWLDPSLAQPMPDVVVVNHLNEPQRQRPIVDLAVEQRAASVEGEVDVRAIFEVTSPLLAEYDRVAKHELYARLLVPEYWIIDTGLRADQEQVNFTILGYRLQDGAYQAIPPTSENRWESRACRLWLSITPDQQSFQLGDLRTGKPFPMPAEEDDPSISTQAEASRRAQSIADQLRLSR